MLVTEIKRLDNKKYCLYLDYEPYSIVYPSDIRRMKLKQGMDADPEVMDEFSREYLRRRAINKAVNSLKYGDRSAFQIRQKLKDSYYNDDITEYVIDKLSELSYIDDYRFAISYINKNISRKSISVIRYELSTKGISRELADKAFEEVDVADTKEILLRVLSKKYTVDYCVSHRDKVLGYFLRKGYDFSEITAAICDFTENYADYI